MRSLGMGGCLALAVATLATQGVAHAAPFKTDHVTAELVAERTAVQPGQPIQIGLRLQHIPHWHTYWRNPGDSGLPTTLAWTLPPGGQTGEIQWPAPKRLPIGPLVNYGYEGDLLLPLQFTPPADAKPGSTLTLSANATWLVCKDVCIPENATLELRLPVADTGTTPGSSGESAMFAQTASQQAAPLTLWKTSAQLAGRELLLNFVVDKSGGAPGQGAGLPPIEVFPYVEQVLEPAAHQVYRTPEGYAVKLALLEGAKPPTALTGIAVAPAGATVWGGDRRSAEFSAAVQSVDAIALPPGAQALAATSEGATPPPSAAAPSRAATPAMLPGTADLGWLAALALAFVGGMVLNLMPCVFPVLSIKLLSLVQQGGDRRALRTHALAYGAGVVLSFVLLAAALIGLRAAGSAVGWGFQLQEPGVVFVLALVFFAIGLNLMGAFEFGNLLPQRLAGWRAERPAADAFASGVLAVVAASPCTAPFMGAALGFAITQSPAVGLSVFAALGLGMALPYAALVLMPGWRQRLPRPGAWMLRLKQALAFPMFATVVWLVWVLGQQAGIDGAAKALLALVGLAFVVWLLGLRGTSAKPVLTVIGAMAMAGVLATTWPVALQANASLATPTASDGAAWQPYDEAVIQQRVAAGQPVFVDFTAAWCVSCQVNKRLVLHTDATMQAFATANVSLMRADWTHRDARITQALARLGRNGVPVYVLLRPGREPLLLPEILTAGIVRDALASL